MPLDKDWLEQEIAVPDLTLKRKSLIELAFTNNHIKTDLKESMKPNRRIKLIEEPLQDGQTTTPEMELTNLINLSSKVEKAVLDLSNACLAFNNDGLKNMSLQLKGKCAAVTQALADLKTSGTLEPEEERGHLEGGEPSLHAKQNLDRAGVIESAKSKYLKRKKLKEAEEDEEEESETVDNTIPKPAGTENTKAPNKQQGKVCIDLTEPFEKVIEGLDDSEFQMFKSGVVSKLEPAIDSVEKATDNVKADEFANSVEALGAANNVSDFDFAMNKIYDFADANDILVETIKRK